MKRVYLDHSATTYTDPSVESEMSRYFSEIFGNPGSVNSFGREAKAALSSAREKVKTLLNASDPEEIIFCSGGTESINLAIQGVAKANKNKGKHIITQKTEHKAVLETCRYLEREGFSVTYLSVDREGLIDLDDLKSAITDETILVSIMYANNEIGTIQPVAEIGKLCREKGVFFHTDACQGGGSLSIDVKELNVDLMTLNGSKLYGPKGVGALYVKQGVNIEPLIYGGGQEFGMRSGTENVPGIMGFAKSLELAQERKEAENARLIVLRDKLIEGLLKIPDTRLNGHATKRLANNASICFFGIDASEFLQHLDEQGIAASAGSTCTTKSMEPSHILTAIGIPEEQAISTIRFSLGKRNTKEDVDYALKVVPVIVESLRKISGVTYSANENRTPQMNE